jgi:hypothetical protein
VNVEAGPGVVLLPQNDAAANDAKFGKTDERGWEIDVGIRNNSVLIVD